jgi:hypothetical protein
MLFLRWGSFSGNIKSAWSIQTLCDPKSSLERYPYHEDRWKPTLSVLPYQGPNRCVSLSYWQVCIPVLPYKGPTGMYLCPTDRCVSLSYLTKGQQVCISVLPYKGPNRCVSLSYLTKGQQVCICVLLTGVYPCPTLQRANRCVSLSYLTKGQQVCISVLPYKGPNRCVSLSYW